MVSVHGAPSAVLVSSADLDALEETIAVLSDSEAVAGLAASDAELAAGLGEPEADGVLSCTAAGTLRLGDLSLRG